MPTPFGPLPLLRKETENMIFCNGEKEKSASENLNVACGYCSCWNL